MDTVVRGVTPHVRMVNLDLAVYTCARIVGLSLTQAVTSGQGSVSVAMDIRGHSVNGLVRREVMGRIVPTAAVVRMVYVTT